MRTIRHSLRSILRSPLRTGLLVAVLAARADIILEMSDGRLVDGD